MRLGEMLATISCRKPLAFRLTLLTAFWSALVSDATSSMALCTLSREHSDLGCSFQCSTAHKTPLYNRFLPSVVEDVVHHIASEHVFVDIPLQDKQHIAEPSCQPTSVSACKQMQQLESYTQSDMPPKISSEDAIHNSVSHRSHADLILIQVSL